MGEAIQAIVGSVIGTLLVWGIAFGLLRLRINTVLGWSREAEQRAREARRGK